MLMYRLQIVSTLFKVLLCNYHRTECSLYAFEHWTFTYVCTRHSIATYTSSVNVADKHGTKATGKNSNIITAEHCNAIATFGGSY